MESRTLTKCPYTLKPLSELPETSREHVILDALGGPGGYSVAASRIENSKLGETLDAAFLSNMIVEAFRSQFGVKSRTGIASWNLSGETVEGNRPVDVTFPHQGPANVYHRKPLDKHPTDESLRIIASAPQAESYWQT